ncbi:MAG: HK97 family phage prohead protease, partial [Pseudomonadota bacterium]
GYAPVEHHRSADGKHRVLSEVDLMEISVVAMPANRRARVREVKQFTSRADVREFLRSTGLPRGAAEKLATGGWPALRGSDLTQIETRALTDSVRKVAALFKGSSK